MKYFKINFHLEHPEGITPDEHQQCFDEILKVIEKYNFRCGGSFSPVGDVEFFNKN